MKQENDLIDRTKRFAYDVYSLLKEIKPDPLNREFISQLIRSAFSVAANYRASQRAKSTRDFANKIKITLEETDESFFWLNCLNDLRIKENEKILQLIKEGNELISIFVTTLNKLEY